MAIDLMREVPIPLIDVPKLTMIPRRRRGSRLNVPLFIAGQAKALQALCSKASKWVISDAQHRKHYSGSFRLLHQEKWCVLDNPRPHNDTPSALPKLNST